MNPKILRAGLMSLALLTAACVTINVYFPEAAIRDLSQKIEDQVAEEAEKAEEPGSAEAAPAEVEETGSAHLGVLDRLLGTRVAFADEVPDPEVTNPAIRKIIQSRAGRVGEVNGFKAQGVVGESNRALLEIRNLEAVADLKERAAVQKLVKAENADREQLFKEIAAEQNVDLSQLPKIRETYAATMRDKARKGDWIQLPSGEWKQK